MISQVQTGAAVLDVVGSGLLEPSAVSRVAERIAGVDQIAPTAAVLITSRLCIVPSFLPLFDPVEDRLENEVAEQDPHRDRDWRPVAHALPKRSTVSRSIKTQRGWLSGIASSGIGPHEAT